MKQLILLQIVGSLLYLTLGQQIDQDCDDGKGVCTVISKCPPIVNNFFAMVDSIKYCDRAQYLICCPKKVPPKKIDFPEDLSKISVQKCIEYHKTVYKKCDPQKLIVGGSKADPHEFPFTAMLGDEKPSGETKWSCGGMLISPKWVLSAAHCFFAFNFSPNRVRLGELDYTTEQDDSQPQNFVIKRHILHPEYDYNKNYNDIVLIELDREAELNKYVVPACLPLTNGTEFNEFIAAGWGLTENKTPSGHLLKVHLDRFDDAECKELTEITDKLDNGTHERTQLCAGSKAGKRDTCQGDSGGPLFVEHPKYNCMFLIVGITSFGNWQCGVEDVPAIYTRVNLYVSWIENIVWNAAGSL